MAFEVVVDEALLSMSATNKEDIIRDLVNALASRKVITEQQVEDVVNGVMERESRGSTGIGNGLAVPHDKACSSVKEFVGVFGRSVEGVRYGSVDGEPAHLFFLLLSPDQQRDAHLEALKHIAAIGRNENFCRFLRDASTVKEVNELVAEAQRP